MNKDITTSHLKVIRWAHESWFNGYHWSESDQAKLEAAIAYFNYIATELKQRKGIE
jgi:hypothetical protein